MPAWPIDDARDRGADLWQGLTANGVPHQTFILTNVSNGEPTEGSGVVRLAASGWIEGRLIKCDCVVTNGHDGGGEVLKIRVAQIQEIGFHDCSLAHRPHG